MTQTRSITSSVNKPARAALIGCGMIATSTRDIGRSITITLSGCADIRDDAARAFAETGPHPASPPSPNSSTRRQRHRRHPHPAASHADVTHAAIRAGVPGSTSRSRVATSPGQAHAQPGPRAHAGVLLDAAPTPPRAPTQAAYAAITAACSATSSRPAQLLSGPERWHPVLQPFHAADAGPLADMGPYYLASLTYLLGRIEGIIGAVTATRPMRTIATGPRAGQVFIACAPTHVTAVLRTETCIPITFTASFDAAGTRAPHLEIHGSKATMVLPDPNFHVGDVLMRQANDRHWKQLQPAEPAVTPVGRGMGVLELADRLCGAPPAPCVHRGGGSPTSPGSSTPSTERQRQIHHRSGRFFDARQKRPVIRPSSPVEDFTVKAVGRLQAVIDRSWPRDNSNVWELVNDAGDHFYLKQHPTARFHEREVTLTGSGRRHSAGVTPQSCWPLTPICGQRMSARTLILRSPRSPGHPGLPPRKGEGRPTAPDGMMALS